MIYEDAEGKSFSIEDMEYLLVAERKLHGVEK